MTSADRVDNLGEFEKLVLGAVLHLGENAYGMTIHEQVEEWVGKWRVVSLGAIYTTLDRLEKKGLVSSWYGDETPERGGRKKRFFKIEGVGQRAIDYALATAVVLTTALRSRRGER
jgi:PadR family transcriptional regulator PadR